MCAGHHPGDGRAPSRARPRTRLPPSCTPAAGDRDDAVRAPAHRLRSNPAAVLRGGHLDERDLQPLGPNGRHVRVVLDIDVLLQLDARHFGAGRQHLHVPGVICAVEIRVPPVGVRVGHSLVERRHSQAIVGIRSEINEFYRHSEPVPRHGRQGFPRRPRSAMRPPLRTTAQRPGLSAPVESCAVSSGRKMSRFTGLSLPDGRLRRRAATRLRCV